MRRAVALALAAALAAHAADLAHRIRAALDASPAARSAFWGIQVVNLETAEILYQSNARRLFVPASNTKLFTTALALTRLPAGFRYTTTVVSDERPDRSGRIAGPLRLVGGGDPNLSNRAIPYRMGAAAGDPLQPIEDLAEQVRAKGVTRVDGDIVGDDSAYVWEPFPDGWSIDDPVWEYGAPVSALTVNDNSFSLNVMPAGQAGGLARLTLAPAIEFYEIDNRVRTVPGVERKISVQRQPGSRQLRVWGVIPPADPGETLLLGIEDPALYAAEALYAALARRGVVIDGRPLARHLLAGDVASLKDGPAPPPAPGFELARRTSAPFTEDLRITDKVSQNLHAELALRAVARMRRGIGSREAGLEEMRIFLDEVGVDPESYTLHDGSGLARLNLVTPEAIVQLLRYMHASPRREEWISLLPVGGVDGTLSGRFGDSAASGRVHAKTGTLSHVSALSGYLERRRGGMLAFSILVNNYNNHAAEIRGIIDRICNLLIE